MRAAEGTYHRRLWDAGPQLTTIAARLPPPARAPILGGMDERDDYDEDGPSAGRRGSPLLTVALVCALVLLVGLLIPCLFFVVNIIRRLPPP